MIWHWKAALGAGAVIAAGVAAAPAGAEEQRVYRIEHPSSGEYRTYYDQQGRVYITTSGDPQIQQRASVRLYEDGDPVPMRYDPPQRVTTETDYDWVYGVDRVDETGRYRVEHDRDANRDTDVRFRSSAGTQSPSATRQWYPRNSQDRWQREDQAEYDVRLDRRGDDVEIRYDRDADDDVTRYERRVYVVPRDRDVEVRYQEARQRPPVPMRYESQYLPPRREVILEGQTYGIEREYRTEIPRYDNRDMRREEFRRDWDSREFDYEQSPLDGRSDRTELREGVRVQPEDFEYRTDGGWYYDEDTGRWLQVSQARQRMNQGSSQPPRD